ncbi:nuclear pore complex protein [Crepidotus variabilis]|uniref:Nuclear pore complex protein n=1 Tax=Crepidotus variabilis TaxID=179855 RepID=A0A9P6EKM0_9AGAR|nr:nuclear pore complex protein [Crepidotus variabilis]
MADGLYASCAEVLSLSQSIKDDLEAVLDPETGFAPRMRQICDDQLEELEEEAGSRRGLADEIDLLRLEANTWGLLQALLPARKTEPPNTQTARDLLLENPYTPTSTLAQAIIQASPLFSELIVVRDWLHETAPPPPLPEATTGYWKFTKHTILQGLRTGHANKDGLVLEMDPDAVNRGDGAGLAADDASYEKSLLQALYGYVRAGRLDDAVEVSRRAHQPWRAASIRGSLLFQWKALSTEKKPEDDEDEDDLETWSGNRNRRLWKATCVRAALSPSLNDQERLLFASLAPTTQTAPLLKASSRTWEDHLWADISVICEDKASRELSRLTPGSFWEGGVEAVDKGFSEAPKAQRIQEEEAWQREVVTSLEKLKSVNVTEGQPASHPYHYSQLLIILDRSDQLLESFSERLQNDAYDENNFEYSAMCRFFAHLCLFLQMIDIPVPPMATQVILESYLEVLEEAGQRDLIALYAGALGDNAVERYAAFLVSLALSADYNERQLALTRANEHGLNVERVAIVTAERTIEKSFSILPTLNEPLPSIINLQPPASEAETFLLRSIEWTTYMDSTYEVALEQATVILRYFLGAGRVQVAQSLLPLLPVELSSISDPEEIATEYLHYRQFFVIWETIEKVVECQSEESTFMAQGTGATREAKAAWLAEYRGLIDQVYDQIVKLLTTEWLIADFESTDLDRRKRQLVRIRQIYIPELILRLHHTLHSSRKLIPENLKRALELANVVADSRYRLYEDFMNDGGRTLAEYLGAVRQAVLAGLENGGSDPFRVVAGL